MNAAGVDVEEWRCEHRECGAKWWQDKENPPANCPNCEAAIPEQTGVRTHIRMVDCEGIG